MQRFKNILLVFAPEARNVALLERAVTLAKRNQAQLTVVRVIDSKPQDVHLMTEVTPARNVHQLAVEAGREQLEKFIAPIRQDRLRVGATVLVGTPFLEIIRAVLREEYDLVMMTAEGGGGLKTWMFGRTSLHLIRKCPCPVWVVKPTARERFARVLAAVDTDPDSMDEEKDALNTSIMGLATSLAQLEGCELHIVHVWRMFGEQLLRSPRARVSPDQVDEWVREDREKHRRQLEVLLAEYALEKPNLQVHLVKGKPGSLISELARKEQIDLIVMGMVCRTGVAGFFIGNTAEKTLQQVDCSVLTVKPDGFVSPVTLGEDIIPASSVKERMS